MRSSCLNIDSFIQNRCVIGIKGINLTASIVLQVNTGKNTFKNLLVSNYIDYT